MKTKSLSVAVLMGGVSNEREVSLRSGKEVAGALKDAGHEVVEIVVDDHEIAELSKHNIDVAFVALHGAFGEDGGVQRLLESKDIPFVGSESSASSLAMNKIETKKVFNYHNMLTPDFVEICAGDSREDTMEKLASIKPPMVVKPAADGSSVGVKIVNDYEELESSVNEVFKCGDQALVEKYIKGREFTVGVLIDMPLPIVEVAPADGFYTYNAKYNDNRTKYLTMVELTPRMYKKIQLLALRAHTALGCRDFSRTDIILGDDGMPYILEVNTIPGFTNRSLFPMAAKAANIDFIQLCDMLVSAAMNRKNEVLAAQSV